MKRIFARVLTIGCCLCASWLAAVAGAAVPPSDQLLPATTKGYVSIPNVDDFRDRWRQMQLGKLAADPIMEPFTKDLQRQIRERYIQNRFNIALTWDELAEACGGELTLAAILPDGNEQAQTHASVLIADITGRQAAAQRVLDEAARQLEAKGGQRRVVRVSEQEMVIYDLPRERGRALADHVIHFLVGDLLVLSNHEAVCAEILRRHLSGEREYSLANTVAFRRVMDRVQSEAGSVVPQVKWFIEPFGYAEVIRAAQVGPRKRRKDMLAIFKSQGFDAIEGAGGWVHLMTDEHELVHRTFVFAPGQPGGESRFRLAARMLDFPNSNQWTWPEWIPRDVASATGFRLKTQQAFEHSSTLVDSIAGDDDFFEDLLASIKDDPNGPQIDVRSEFIAYLGERVTVVSDHTFPITPQSERILIAVNVEDEEAVRLNLHRALVSDPDTRQLDVEGHTVWEILNRESATAPDLDLGIDGIGGIDPIREAPAAEEPEEYILRNSALTVAYGQFMVATHVDVFRKIFAQRPNEDRLPLSEDVQLIATHLQRLGAGSDSLRSFSRTDETARPTYELIRQGKMPESESILGRLLNRLLGPDSGDVLRTQTIDGSQLPDFQAVRRYLGPAGVFSRSEEDGWYLSGLLLNKQTLYLDGGEPLDNSRPSLDSPTPSPTDSSP